MFRKVLIANRGEIAIRIARACRELGIRSVAVYSEADRAAPHVRAADDAVLIGPAPSRESYLSISSLVEAARASGADAIHPGYGFLSENAAFAAAVEAAGLVFIGPAAAAIAAMGDKTAARTRVRAAGVPIVPALEDPPADSTALRSAAADLGFPLLVKAAGGGGGKGMRVVRAAEELGAALAAAQREATAAFGDGRVFLERYLEQPRHIEVQILADQHGSIIHLGERECSIQRRHQKIVEESPSPAVSPALRAQMTEAAVAAARSVGYTNAGTVEFLLADSGQFYFLEMNTRLQVEHPVTEWVYDVDLVHAQIRIAAGERLWLRQTDIEARGHAIECRVYAEDPSNQFLPSPGRIALLREPHGPGIRIDSGIAGDYDVPLHYDPLLAKLSVWAADRNAACCRMAAALREYVVLGITTNIPFLLEVIRHPAFSSGATHTHFLDEHLPGWREPHTRSTHAAIVAALHTMHAPTTPRAGAGAQPSHLSPWQTLGAWRAGAS